jgi:hypothetical protein
VGAKSVHSRDTPYIYTQAKQVILAHHLFTDSKASKMDRRTSIGNVHVIAASSSNKDEDAAMARSSIERDVRRALRVMRKANVKQNKIETEL